MQDVNAAIITIGDELLIGQTIDTNSTFISQELNKIGVWVKRKLAVGDVKEDILQVLEHQSKDCNIIIITGGLGPTADDITKPALCEYFKTELTLNKEALQNVKTIFEKFNRPVTERNIKQAEVPENCTVLQNKRGTAPGMWFKEKDVIIISLPGVPHEMKGLVMDEVLPKLQQEFRLPAVVHKTLLTAGIGESQVADLLSEFENNLPPHIRLAYLPAYGMVRLRLTTKGVDKNQLESETSTHFNSLKIVLRKWLIADEDITLQEALNRLLKEKNKTVATAESCTGGYIAHLITSIAGSSEIFKGSVVAYDNEVKENTLNVNSDTLKKYGAVSEETVIEMAESILKKINTDYAIATSGIMGPGGGSDEKPVGTVWIAVAGRKQTKASKFHFRFDRMRNIELTAHTALVMLFRFIQNAE